MSDIFYFNIGTEKTFLHTIKIFLDDIKKLEIERGKFFDEYCKNPSMDNMALFISRAKHMEQMLILGITGEYLIKAILLKHGFIINELNKNSKFSDAFLSKLEELRGKGTNAGADLVQVVRNLADKDLIASLSEKTIGFEECIQLFKKNICYNDYFLNCPEYEISGSDTQEFYGKRLTYNTLFKTLQDIRNNYGHVPEAKYEENGIMPFIYNFLIFVCKKEFPEFYKDNQNFKEDKNEN